MFERIDREADGEVYINEVLDFLQSMASDLEQVRLLVLTFILLWLDVDQRCSRSPKEVQREGGQDFIFSRIHGRKLNLQ